MSTLSDEGSRLVVFRDAGRADTLSKISRYEMRLTHRYNRALSRLAWLQDERTSSTTADSSPQK